MEEDEEHLLARRKMAMEKELAALQEQIEKVWRCLCLFVLTAVSVYVFSRVALPLSIFSRQFGEARLFVFPKVADVCHSSNMST